MNRLGRLSLRLYSTNTGSEFELLRRQVNTYQVLSEQSLQTMERQIKEQRLLAEKTSVKLQRLQLTLFGGWIGFGLCVATGFPWH